MSQNSLCTIIVVTIWISVTIGISIAIWETKSFAPLGFYIIPACIRVNFD